MSFRPSFLGCVAWLGLLAPAIATQAPPRPQPYCLRNVALDRAGTAKATLVLRDGKIAAVLDASAPPPAGTRVIEGEGLICLPAFLDAFTRHGFVSPQPVRDQDLPPNELADVGIDMRLANRKGIQPAVRAVEALSIAKEQGEAWRKQGFGAALVAPGGELLSGASTLATTREAAMRDVVLRDEVFAHAAFSATGPGYPGTLMGYFAQLRQFLLDSRHQIELEQRFEQGRPGPRPPFDRELAAGAEIVAARRALACEASEADEIERWLRLADEFELAPDFVGGLEAWKLRERLAERDATVVLTLEWGKEVDDPRPKNEEKEPPAEKAPEAPAAPEAASDEAQADGPAAAGEETHGVETTALVYQEPYAVRLERRVRWEAGRDCAARLDEVGVRFVFGSASQKPSELLERVRTLVEHGLSAEAALVALTQDAAEYLGVGQRLGRLAVGYDATLVLWRADPLVDEDASVAWSFVDGFPSEFPAPKKKEKKAKDGTGAGPEEGVDPSGTWELVFEGAEAVEDAVLVLAVQPDGSVGGSLGFKNPMGAGRVEAEVEGRVEGDELELECRMELGEFKIESTLTATIDGDELEGESAFEPPGGGATIRQAFHARRKPE